MESKNHPAGIRRLFILFVLFAASVRLEPLELQEGRLRLVLHAGMGRFSLYALGDDPKSANRPLFVAQDPRTSYWSIVVDGRVAKLGESGEYRESLEAIAGGGRFTWTSSRLIVTEAISLGQGALITLTVKNISERSLEVGLRFLLDTYLGEMKSPHFHTEGLSTNDREAEFHRERMPSSWISGPIDSPGEPALQGILKAEGFTPPDRLVFANWKRLNEASWSYEPVSARDFSDPPYSINDSAVCYFYDPFILNRGEERSIRIALRIYSPAGYVPPVTPDEGELGRLLKSAEPASAGVPSPRSRKEDLELLNSLLKEIETKRQSQAVSEEELGLLRRILDALKTRLEPARGVK